MRKILFATVAFAALCGASVLAARAQLDIQVNTTDPLTKLAADKWIYLVTHIVNSAPLIGKDGIYMLNATGEPLNAVVCKGYFLVGPKPYITSNDTTHAPASLPPWTVTLVPTEGFNKYCMDGVDAQGAAVNYHGTLNAADKSFQNSTYVVFNKPVGQ